MKKLGRWAVIDLETTGTQPLRDDIIEVGFLRFENCALVERYQSLVHSSSPPSLFIQKLTGITPAMLEEAPPLEEIEAHLKSLRDSTLIAHNAAFDRSYLPALRNNVWEDSIPWLALLFPHFTSCKLESFLKRWNLAEKEQHRGFDDARDLLKVLIVAGTLTHRAQNKKTFLLDILRKGGWEEGWFTRFLQLDDFELKKIADAIDFDRDKAITAIEASEKTSSPSPNEIPSLSQEFHADNIRDIYRSSLFPGYVQRKSQEDLAVRVGQSFGNDVHALIQAPTGTGKTLGYLIPAALFSLNRDKSVLISTGTKALQKQAMEKDIPLLQDLLSNKEGKSPLRVERLVGSSNHLCELLFHNHQKENFLFKEDWDIAYGDLYLQMIFFHNTRETLDNQILRDDIPWALKKNFPALEKQERQIAVDFRSCSGHRCPLRHNCSYHRNLQAAKEADIIVGNHALMFSWPKGFPRPSHIIVDEAHKIEDEATSAFSLTLEQHSLQSFVKSLEQYRGIGALFFLISQTEENPELATSIIEELKKSILPIANKLEENIQPLEDLIEDYVRKSPRHSPDYWNIHSLLPWDETMGYPEQALYRHWENIHSLLEDLSHMLHQRYSLVKEDDHSEARTTFETFLANLEDLYEPIDWLLQRKPEHSYSLGHHLKHGYVLTISPINVGKEIHDRLLDVSSSVVFTSATLASANNGGSPRGVEWITGHSYLPSTKRFQRGLFLPPIYDYKNNTRIFLCDDAPSFLQKNFVRDILQPILPLITKIEGGSLLLFSSRKRFEEARDILWEKFEGHIPLFAQGMGGSVVEDFKSASKGILLGMESFGEGIDIPGKKLQFMFIDKIPDLRQEPVIQERRHFYNTNFGNEFTDYFLSHRSRALHQKLGRLIRKESDVGGAIVVDARMKKWKSRTREQFTQMMNPYQLQNCSLKEACGALGSFLT